MGQSPIPILGVAFATLFFIFVSLLNIPKGVFLYPLGHCVRIKEMTQKEIDQ